MCTILLAVTGVVCALLMFVWCALFGVRYVSSILRERGSCWAVCGERGWEEFGERCGVYWSIPVLGGVSGTGC